MLRAIPLIGRMERGPFMQAGEYLSHAIELEPEYAAAYAWYAYWHDVPGRPGLGRRSERHDGEGGQLSPSGLSCSTRSMRGA